MSRDRAAILNQVYYDQPSVGREDYWRYMAAPRFRAATILRCLGQEEVSSIVDLGCGGGLLLAEIAERFPAAKLAGVDLSPRQVDDNRARLPGIEWCAVDLDRSLDDTDALASMAGRFAAIVASEILEHLDHPDVFLRNARRLAAPGGRLVLSTQSGPIRETEMRVGHRRHWTRADLNDALASTGWTAEQTWNAGFPFHDLSKWWANRDPDASMRRFGGDRYGRGERLICWALRVAFRFNSRRRGAQLFTIARAAASTDLRTVPAPDRTK